MLSDSDLGFLADTGTEIRARIRVNDETGTVAKGALWYEENLPAESVLWGIGIGLGGTREPCDAQSTAQRLREGVGHGKLLQIGGKATVGRGWRASSPRETRHEQAIQEETQNPSAASESCASNRTTARSTASGQCHSPNPRTAYGTHCAGLCLEHVAAGKLAKDYKPRAMSFSTMVLQSGLAQAVGFLAAKGAGSNDKDKAYKHYLGTIRN